MNKIKEYSNRGTIVVWEAEKCIHKGLSEVFQPREQPRLVYDA